MRAAHSRVALVRTPTFPQSTGPSRPLTARHAVPKLAPVTSVQYALPCSQRVKASIAALTYTNGAFQLIATSLVA